MKKSTLVGMVATGALVATTGLAFAQGTQQKGQQGQQQMQGQQGQQGQQAQQGQQGQQQTLAHEQLDGRIVSVDKNKGTLSIQTAQHGQLEFKLTPAQVQRLTEGEQVRLQIHIQPMPKQQ